MMGVITKSWVFTTAQTDTPLETVGGSVRMAVTYASVTCANSNTNDVLARIGFAATTLPAESTTGADGMFFEHGGIAKGGGALAANGGEMIAVGDYGVPPRFTCSSPAGGSVRVVMSWRLLE
jgi:hypothetical protein